MKRSSLRLMLVFLCCLLAGCYLPSAGVILTPTSDAAALDKNQRTMREAMAITTSFLEHDRFYAVSNVDEKVQDGHFRIHQTFSRKHPFTIVTISFEGNGSVTRGVVGFSEGEKLIGLRGETIRMRDELARQLKNKLGDESVLITQY